MKKIDKDQSSFSFEGKIERLIEAKTAALESAAEPAPASWTGGWMEASAEIAVAVKKAIRESGLSREQVVDEVNDYFGWPTVCVQAGRTGNKLLSIHMLNHYLSKPHEYPLPAYLLFALQDVTGSLEPARVLAEAEGGRVISSEEVRLMTLGRLEDTITEMQRLKKEIKRGRL